MFSLKFRKEPAQKVPEEELDNVINAAAEAIEAEEDIDSLRSEISKLEQIIA